MLDDNDEVRFDEWTEKLRKELDELGPPTSKQQLVWLWDTLRTEPGLKLRFGDLQPVGTPQKRKGESFKVFEAGEWFVIGMKRAQVAELLKESNRTPRDEAVAVQIKDELSMKPGSGGRLACCDCKAEVTIKAGKVLAIDREADIMSTEKDRITLGNDFVTIQVKSLNEAYTVSSLRLEPERRGPGGRIYDHVIHVRRQQRQKLEEIRQKVETGDWNVPSSSQQ